MRSVEASGKTRKDAVQTALDQLKAELHEVKVEVLDEGSRGLFGFGARDVRVRVTREGAADDDRDEQPQRHRGGAAQRNRAAAPQASRPTAPPANRPAAPQASRPVVPASSQPMDPRGNDAAALLQEMVRRMGIDAKVTSDHLEDGSIRLNVDSPDSAILIGRKGKTLQSLQYLINRMVNTGEDPDKVERIIVDVEGYLGRRRESLEELAHRLAERAKETQKRVRLKPLDPQERRIIHLTLQDNADVETYSVGNAQIRSVVIQPKGMAQLKELPDDEESEGTGERRERGERGGRRGGRGGERRGGDRGRPRGERPAGERAGGDRPRGERPAGDRPRGERSDRPRGERAGGDRPRGERPVGDRSRGGRPGDGERRGGDAPRGDRPPRRSENGPRGENTPRAERPEDPNRQRRRRGGSGGGRSREGDRSNDQPITTPRSSALFGGPREFRREPDREPLKLKPAAPEPSDKTPSEPSGE